MEWLLRRNYWMVRLFGLIVVTALTANTATTLLGLYLLSSARTMIGPDGDDDDADEETGEDDEPANAVLASGATTTDDRARRAERTAERILGYDPFCPGCKPEAQAPVEPELETPDTSEAALAGAKRSALPLVVAATMEAERPEHSLATLVDTERGIGGLFGVGDRLSGQIEVVSVDTGMVHILNEGRLEYIPFSGVPREAPKPTAAKSSTTPAKTKPPTNGRAIEGAEEAIQCSEAGDCVIERQFVEKLIAEPRLLMGQGAAAPTTTKSGAPGFKLRGVRSGTLPALLGLKTGDVITEVNGTALTLDTVTGLFGKLRHASNLEVTVDRRGTTMRRQLEIR